MSDELEKLEKAWDESKYDPNISLREMWDREEEYRRKKEEEDARIKREDERKAEERRQQEERKKEEERLRKMFEEQERERERERERNRPSPGTVTSLPKPDTSTRPWAPEEQADQRYSEPTTPLEFVLSLCALAFCGLVGALPILCIFFIGKIIRAFSWSFSHWFCIITFASELIILGYFILLIGCTIYFTNKKAKKKRNKAFCLGLYCLGGLIYFLLCRHLVQKGEKLYSVIFSQFPILLYFPAAINLFIYFVEIYNDKSARTLKNLTKIFFFPLIVCAVWGGFFLLSYFLAGAEWSVSELKIPLRWWEAFFSAIWHWFSAPLLDGLHASSAHYTAPHTP